MNEIIFNTALIIAFAMLMLSLIITLFRLINGPTISDRVAAMDLIASVASGFILIYSIRVRLEVYFDIVIIISLISFIGTLAISYYLKLRK